MRLTIVLSVILSVFSFAFNSFSQGTSVGIKKSLSLDDMLKSDSLQHPEIGKPIPEFQLENIGNFKKSKMATADFKGRFVILDFWNKNCVSCVQSFPKLNDDGGDERDDGFEL